MGISERRAVEREGYCCAIRVADLTNGQIPPEHKFLDVETRDLSPDGVSFLAIVPPEKEHIVFWLGGNLSPIYVVARVVHKQPGYWTAHGPQWLIGCEFVDPS